MVAAHLPPLLSAGVLGGGDSRTFPGASGCQFEAARKTLHHFSAPGVWSVSGRTGVSARSDIGMLPITSQPAEASRNPITSPSANPITPCIIVTLTPWPSAHAAPALRAGAAPPRSPRARDAHTIPIARTESTRARPPGPARSSRLDSRAPAAYAPVRWGEERQPAIRKMLARSSCTSQRGSRGRGFLVVPLESFLFKRGHGFARQRLYRRCANRPVIHDVSVRVVDVEQER